MNFFDDFSWKKLNIGKMSFCFLLLVLSACTSAPLEMDPTATSSAPPVIFQTFTPFPTQTATIPPATSTFIPLPTATLMTYTVAAKDTLIGIAVRFGLTLDELLAANPGVDPQFLSIGTSLVIPSADGAQSPELEATPLPLEMTHPICYPTLEGGQWCFVEVSNSLTTAVENLSVRMVLQDAQGQTLADQMAFGWMNRLAVDQSMPLGVYFPPPLPIQVNLESRLISALPISENDERYLPIQSSIDALQFGQGNLLVNVQGYLRRLNSVEAAAQSVWALGIGFAKNGDVVAVRRWEASSETLGDAQIPYEIRLYSLGPEIDHVIVLAEARR